jgi:hypothetical protein
MDFILKPLEMLDNILIEKQECGWYCSSYCGEYCDGKVIHLG